MAKLAKPKVTVGIIGCGNISSQYIEVGQKFEILEIVACADIDQERANEQVTKYALPQVLDVEELLADQSIDLVLNITPPSAHAEIGLAAIEAGKSVYNEKPLAVNRGNARMMLNAAESQGVLIGCAPDTFMGAGLQTCRKLIDEGLIGEPVAATAFMLNHGHESWHPAPDFFYQEGGGPLFDMGPYYLTALLYLIGSVRRVTGSTRITFPERTITSGPLVGTKIKVNTPTHIVGVLDFDTGAIGTIVTSFDVWAAEVPRIEIYGTTGTLSVPDPNTYGGPVQVHLAGANEWTQIPLTHGHANNSRSIGVADMAYAMRSGRPHRANGELAYHVLDIMHAIHEAAQSGRHIDITSSCQRPKPLPIGMSEYELDD